MRELKLRSLFSAVASLIVLGSVQALGLGVGQVGPCVVLTDIQPNGKEIEQCIRTRDANQKYTLMEFFSISCEDCQVNLPIVSQLTPNLEKTTKTRLIAIDKDEVAVRSYLKDQQSLIGMPVALDSMKQAVRAYDVILTPTLFLIDKKNNIIFKHEGILTDADKATLLSLTVN